MTLKIGKDFVWSFSKLSTFSTCPYSFYLQYLQSPPLPKDQNAFAEFGNLCHSLLERYGKGEIEQHALTAEYQLQYPNFVVHSFPPTKAGDYAEKTYQQGLEYFAKFKGFGNYEIVSTEEPFNIMIGGNCFTGISDLVLKNKETGELTVVDHKTKSGLSMKNEFELYRRQLYVYAEHVRQKYGVFPANLQFNMIKTRSAINEPFSHERHLETMRWIEDSIDLITFEFDWTAKPNYYYCKYICPVFQHCESGMECCRALRKKKR